jgi:exodeoxyribonuclease III
MKIITWNCNMAYRKKAVSILAYKPDIVVVPECEHPDKLLYSPNTPTPTDVLWFGTNHHKGLGIFSYSNYRFKLLDCHNPNFKLIVPIEASNGKSSFNLFAIWANNPEDRRARYVEQVWKAIQHYDTLLTERSSILIGDFNSNTIWDREHRDKSHSSVVQLLEAKGIHSTYHLHHKQIQGQEQHPTLYMYRHRNKPYHLDYCFVSSDLLKRLKSVEVGAFEDWSAHSDHVPLIVTFRATK